MPLVILGMITIVSLAGDFVATAMGSQRVVAGRLALMGAVIRPFAGLAAGFSGVCIGRLWAHRSRRDAAPVHD